jgi:CheY-like chemotaxis protein
MYSILIVDDSPVDRLMAARLLQGPESFQTLEASNGQEALYVLRENDVAVVVTDMQMPEMNGLQLLDQVLREKPRVPVVIMTAKGSEDLAVQALEHGAASYVPKRRLAADLRPTVERLCRLTHDDETYAALADRLTSVESHYDVENDLALLLSLAGYLPLGVDNFWEATPTLRTQLSVALEEALTNAYFYGSLELDPQLKSRDPEQFYQLANERKSQSGFQDRRVHVTARYSPDEVAFTIRDEGPGFDTARAVAREDTADLTDGSGGRGLRLMRTFLDRVEFNSRGNEVTLVKRRAADSECR